MSKYNKTPLLQVPRQSGGTLYVFPSAHEDIGLNMNYRVNSVALSHYALLNIPSGQTDVSEENPQRNHFNPTLIPGHFSWNTQHSSESKDAGWEIAASLQNYAMNFETLLLNQDDYNYSDPHTVSERVFWKWLKETGAIRWEKTNTANTYKEHDSSETTGYESIVKCFGAIDAGNSVSSEFGMFNETYVNIPTSYGGGKVFFKVYDSDTNLNYKLNYIYNCSADHLEGRDSAMSDYSYTVNYPFSDYSSNTGVKPEYQQGSYFLETPAYITQANFNDVENGDIDSKVEYTIAGSTMSFLRSNLDGVEIIKDLSSLQTVFNSVYGKQMPTIHSYDDINIKTDFAPASKFDFNAVLLYYSVYDSNNANRTPVATNLFGILFLDAPANSVSSENQLSFNIPTITKKKSSESGFGTGYSFRVNVKTQSVYDNTDAYIEDNTTASSVLVNDFSGVIKNLNKAIENMNVNVYNTQKIQENYVVVRNYYDALKTAVDNMGKKLDSYVSGKYSNVLNTSTLYTQNIASGDTVTNQKLSINIPTAFTGTDSSSYSASEVTYSEAGSFDASGFHTTNIDASVVNIEKEYFKVKEYSGDTNVYSGNIDDEVNALLDEMFNGTSPSLQINLAAVQDSELYVGSDGIDSNTRSGQYELYVSPNSSAFLDTASKINLSNLINKSNNVIVDSENLTTVNEAGINYAKMVPYLIAYIQKLNARLTVLERTSQTTETA